MNIQDIKDRLLEAADVDRRLYQTIGPRGYGNGWPDVVRSAREAYGYDTASARPAVPSNEEIDRAEEAANWLTYLDYKARRMMWAWANQTQLWKIGQRYNKSEGQIRYWRDQCCERILKGLSKRRAA